MRCSGESLAGQLIGEVIALSGCVERSAQEIRPYLTLLYRCIMMKGASEPAPFSKRSRTDRETLFW